MTATGSWAWSALAAVVAASIFALFVVPPDLNQGDAQRIMYVHVPSAWLAYLSFGVTALAGIGYLWRRDLRFDAVALAGAEIGVMFTAFAIWGGMMWGRPVWGVFWQWEDPRLTTTALLLALYLGYLLIRRLTEDPVPPRDARRGGRHHGRGRHPDRPLQRRVVARPAPGPDHRLARQGPQPIGAGPVRDRAGGHGGRLHPRLGLAHDPPLPAGPDRVADRGARRASAVSAPPGARP